MARGQRGQMEGLVKGSTLLDNLKQYGQDVVTGKKAQEAVGELGGLLPEVTPDMTQEEFTGALQERTVADSAGKLIDKVTPGGAGVIIGKEAIKRMTAGPMKQKFIQAQEMQKQGFPNRLIFQETGVQAGFGGKLRAEISDKSAKWKEPMEKWQGKQNLEDVLDHPALFAAYPGLRKYKIVAEEMEGMAGLHNPLTSTIKINPKSKTSPLTQLGTAMHEIQHAIQMIEKFPGGTTPEGALKVLRGLKTFDEGAMTPEAVEKVAGKMYMLKAGEVEARLVQNKFLSDVDAPLSAKGKIAKQTKDRGKAADIKAMINERIDATPEAVWEGTSMEDLEGILKAISAKQ